MGINKKKCLDLIEKYPKVLDCVRQSTQMNNALPSYEYLCNLRNEIPKELYAFFYRKLLQFCTGNVSREKRLEMFNGIDKNDIMYQDELDAIEEFDEIITIYRGTVLSETTPGLSWTIYEHMASSKPFYRGKLLKAEIPKKDILLYLAHEEDEGEIIADVRDYEVIG